MYLLNEYTLEKYSGKVFGEMLFELLDNEKIKHANTYWKRGNKGVRFDKTKMADYAEEDCVKREKNDLHRFVVRFANGLRSDPMIDDVHPSKSKEFGMSDYIYVDFRKPTDPRLDDFYKQHEKDYKGVKTRFSDHKESSLTPKEKKSKIFIHTYNKTFIEASKEMEQELNNYKAKLQKMENDYIAELEQQDENVDESFKLRISEY